MHQIVKWQLQFRLHFYLSDWRLEQLLKFRCVRYLRILLICIHLLALTLLSLAATSR